MPEETQGNEFEESRLENSRPIATGATLVIMKPDRMESFGDFIASTARSVDSMSNVLKMDFASDVPDTEADAMTIDELGVAVIQHPDSAAASAIVNALRESDAVEEAVPEFYVFAEDDAIQTVSPMYVDTATHTWGLQAVGADGTAFTGNGAVIAVLDTGIDVHYPELMRRVRAHKSFVPNESVDDLNGHGTHCAGTIAGPMNPAGAPRYGVAPDATLIIGKVLSNRGSGRERDILAGIVWAVRQGAHVVSMSLGRATRPGQGHHVPYERAAQYALSNNSLIIAAAGNDSARRYGYVAPVGAPADSPSAMAIAAVDQALIEADFSCGGINPGGGQIDVAAPGTDVLSSWPLPRRHRSISGTSMACPHVAGIAALYIEAQGVYGAQLRQALTSGTRNIGRPARDVGNGLVQVP